MSGKTVLYVEDNEYNLKIVRQLLARTAYKLIEAKDGESGVETALRELPDLILMDIQLPKLSGLDATRRLRADPKTAAIPIIVITSFALSGDDQKAKDAGASAYLAKPYSPRELLQMIRNLVRELSWYGRKAEPWRIELLVYWRSMIISKISRSCERR